MLACRSASVGILPDSSNTVHPLPACALFQQAQHPVAMGSPKPRRKRRVQKLATSPPQVGAGRHCRLPLASLPSPGPGYLPKATPLAFCVCCMEGDFMTGTYIWPAALHAPAWPQAQPPALRWSAAPGCGVAQAAAPQEAVAEAHRSERAYGAALCLHAMRGSACHAWRKPCACLRGPVC